MNLKDQTAIVTGGGRGIGRAIAQSLASAGARVAVLARSAREVEATAVLIQRSGGTARAFTLDVTDPAAVKKIFAEIERSLGPCDILINNAGDAGQMGPLWEDDPERWWHTLAINLRGPMLCAHAVLPGMVSRRRGYIINVSSGAAYLPMAHFTPYTVSKAALVRLSESLATEAAPYGVKVFPSRPARCVPP